MECSNSEEIVANGVKDCVDGVAELTLEDGQANTTVININDSENNVQNLVVKEKTNSMRNGCVSEQIISAKNSGESTPEIFSSCSASPFKVNAKVASDSQLCDLPRAVNDSLVNGFANSSPDSDGEESENIRITTTSFCNHVQSSFEEEIQSSNDDDIVASDTPVNSTKLDGEFVDASEYPAEIRPDCSYSNNYDERRDTPTSEEQTGHNEAVLNGPSRSNEDKLNDSAAIMQNFRRGGKRRRYDAEVKEKVKVHNPDDPDSVCGLIFVHRSTTAKMVYRLLKVSRC